MIDIKETLEPWCEEHGYLLIFDTATGINQSADQCASDGERQPFVWLNVVEQGDFMEGASGLLDQINRTIEIVLFKHCIHEDDGINYYEIFQGMRGDALSLFHYLRGVVEQVSAFTMNTGVDELDENCCMIGLNLTFTDSIGCVE